MRNSRQNKFLNDKKNAQNAHFKRRMIERYNIFFNRKEKAKVLSSIKCDHEDAVFLYKKSNTRSVWQVEMQGKRIPIVYDRARQNLVTCLTWSMVEENMKEFE